MSDSSPTAATPSDDAGIPAIADLLSRQSGGARDRLSQALETLDLPEPVSSESDRRLLVDVTFARILRARDEQAVARLSPEPRGPALTERDAEAIDEVIEAGWEAGDSDRARRAHTLLSLLDAPTPDAQGADRTRLVDGALALVQSDMDQQADRLKLEPPIDRPSFSTPGIRWRELGAIAAMLLIAAGIFWPMVNGVRVEARRSLGQANMQQSSLGFGLFASDHDDRLPAVGERGNEGLWWQVGTPAKSHSANLYTLVRTSYVPIGVLASPGNPYAPTEITDADALDWRSSPEVSYSYQLFGKRVPRLASVDGGSRVLLADRSPVVERARQGLPIDPRANSSNHAGLGQFALWSNGAVRFLRSPVLENGDNIWLPGRLEQAGTPHVVGTELPMSRGDAFVGP